MNLNDIEQYIRNIIRRLEALEVILSNLGLVSIEDRTQTPTGKAMNVQIGPGDVISNIPVFMDFEHHQIHEGETFKAHEQQLALGTGTVKYSLDVGAHAVAIYAPHLVIEADVFDGAVRVDLYEGATYTGGTAMTIRGRHRGNTGSATMVVKTGVTSTDGTRIDSFFAGGGKSTAGSGRVGSEWPLKANTTYRVDFVGLSAGTQVIPSFNWYEDLGV